METHPTAAEFNQGVRRLRDLLPWARSQLRKIDADPALHEMHLGPLALAVRPHVREDNFESLVIYPAPLGGYHTDLFLRKIPAGVPNSLGSPVANPLATKQEAEAVAKSLLIAALSIAMQAPHDSPAAHPTFLFYDGLFRLDERILEFGDKVGGSCFGTAGMRAACIDRFDRLVAELFPGGFSEDVCEALPTDAMAKLSAAAHAAALNGIFAYPSRKDAPPPTHETHQTKN